MLRSQSVVAFRFCWVFFGGVGGAMKLGVRGEDVLHAPVLESGNKNFGKAFCKDLA